MELKDYSLFSNNAGNSPKERAQENLKGRTHYADPDTLRFFDARILDCEAVQGGHLLAIVESVPEQPGGGPRVYRPTVFDRFGEVVSERPFPEDCPRNAATARRQLVRILAELDGPAITAEGAEAYSHQIQREAARAVDDLRSLWESESLTA